MNNKCNCDYILSEEGQPCHELSCNVWKRTNKLEEEFNKNLDKSEEKVKWWNAEKAEKQWRKDTWKWITKHYISKEQILNLECLKEEETVKHIDVVLFPKQAYENLGKLTRNQLRKKIIEEINKL